MLQVPQNEAQHSTLSAVPQDLGGQWDSDSATSASAFNSTIPGLLFSLWPWLGDTPTRSSPSCY